MTHLYSPDVGIADSQILSPFGRHRTAATRLLGEYRFMYGSGTVYEINQVTVGGGTATTDFANVRMVAAVGTASGDKVIVQTKQYHPYIVGTSNVAYISFTMSPGKTNLTQRIGMFDDQNGIFGEYANNEMFIVIRNNGVDEHRVPRSQWNVDRLDGSKNEFNPSGITFDPSKTQIMVVDYQWMGAGQIRVGVMTGTTVSYFHTFRNTNTISGNFMSQPSLPVRWEIVNTGTTASASELHVIAAAVHSEGSDFETGFTRSISTDGTPVTLSAANAAAGRGVLAIRLKNSLVGKQNKSLARLKVWEIFSSGTVNYKIVILPGSASIGAATWDPVPGYSWCEFAKNFPMATGWAALNNYNVLHDGFVSGSQGRNYGGTIQHAENRSSTIYQNYDSTDSQILCVIGYNTGADVTVQASLSWIEVK